MVMFDIDDNDDSDFVTTMVTRCSWLGGIVVRPRASNSEVASSSHTRSGPLVSNNFEQVIYT